jgi:hypothetical protein
MFGTVRLPWLQSLTPCYIHFPLLTVRGPTQLFS